MISTVFLICLLACHGLRLFQPTLVFAAALPSGLDDPIHSWNFAVLFALAFACLVVFSLILVSKDPNSVSVSHREPSSVPVDTARQPPPADQSTLPIFPIWILWLTVFLAYLAWTLVFVRLLSTSVQHNARTRARRILLWISPKVRRTLSSTAIRTNST